MESDPPQNLATPEDFFTLDIRVGRIISVEVNTKAKNPAYLLTIDFGPLGVKTSSAQITENYTGETLLGQQVTAIVNFPAKRVAGVKSECLVLAAVCEERGNVLLQPNLPVRNGSRVA